MFTTDDHWRYFSEFCRLELASGGPDPQLAMVADMTAHLPLTDRVWAALCYIAPYNVPYGEVVWTRHPWDSVCSSIADLNTWIDQAFADGKFVTRFERRCVRRADWMREYFAGAREFVLEYQELSTYCEALPFPRAYDYAYARVTSVPRIGRYVAIKLIELLRRSAGLQVITPDIRPRDAWSPRLTINALLPELTLTRKGNDPALLAAVNAGCDTIIARLEAEYDIHIDLFQLQVLLCEYRESWEGKRQYPGRSLDSELGYARRAEEQWGHKSGIWESRARLFPHQHLGEREDRGWPGPRKDVAVVLATHKYTWSDLVYDYTKTGNMAEPVRWAA